VHFGDHELDASPGQKVPSGIKYGWEPDGSGKEWDNKNHRGVLVEWCNFTVKFGGPEPIDDEDEAASQVAWLPASNRDIADVRNRIAGVEASLQKFSGHALVIGWVIAGLLGILAFR